MPEAYRGSHSQDLAVEGRYGMAPPSAYSLPELVLYVRPLLCYRRAQSPHPQLQLGFIRKRPQFRFLVVSRLRGAPGRSSTIQRRVGMHRKISHGSKPLSVFRCLLADRRYRDGCELRARKLALKISPH